MDTQMEYIAEFQDMENLLSCPICYEFMDTAMIIPQCSHNFCSLCIRRHIGYKTQCPTCKQPVTEPELRNNRLLDELIQVYKAAKIKLKNEQTNKKTEMAEKMKELEASCSSSSTELDQCKKAVSENMKSDVNPNDHHKSRKSISKPNTEILSHVTSTPTKSRSSALKMTSPLSAYLTSPSVASTSSISGQEQDGNPNWKHPKSKNSEMRKVSCPVCEADIPEKNINLHLDRCLIRSEKEESVRKCTVKQKPLSKFVYSLMKVRDLRKKLAELGLPIDGDRETLIRRHQEFVLRYNSQCDSLNPKPVKQIIREVLEGEKKKSLFVSKSPGTLKLKIEKGATEQEIEENRKKYVKRHQDQFTKLISETRNRLTRLKQLEEKEKKDCKRLGSQKSPFSQSSTTYEDKSSDATLNLEDNSFTNDYRLTCPQVCETKIQHREDNAEHRVSQTNNTSSPSSLTDDSIKLCDKEDQSFDQMTVGSQANTNLNKNVASENLTPLKQDTSLLGTSLSSPAFPTSPSLYSDGASPCSVRSSDISLPSMQKMISSLSSNCSQHSARAAQSVVNKVCRVLNPESHLLRDNSPESIRSSDFGSLPPSTQPGSKEDKENISNVEKIFSLDCDSKFGCSSPDGLSLSPNSPISQKHSNGRKRKQCQNSNGRSDEAGCSASKIKVAEEQKQKRRARKAESCEVKQPTRRSRRCINKQTL